MNKNKVVYKITVEDINIVAEEYLERNLNNVEIKKVINKVGDYISWHDAIEYTFDELGIKSKDELEEEANNAPNKLNYKK